MKKAEMIGVMTFFSSSLLDALIYLSISIWVRTRVKRVERGCAAVEMLNLTAVKSSNQYGRGTSWSSGRGKC